MEGWKKRRGKGGRVEGWKRGWLEGWKVGRLYGWKEEAQSRMNVLQVYQDGWGREKGMGGSWKKGRLEEGMGGRLEEGKVGRGEEGMGGRLEEGKVGRGEEGMGGRLEGWRVVWVGGRSTIKDECGRIRVWYSALDLSIWMG